MNRTGGRLLRRLVAAAFLLASLVVQLQVVYACALLDSTPASAECCCDHDAGAGCAMGGSCHPSSPTPGQECCAVSIATPASPEAATRATSVPAVALLNAPQPPPALPAAPPARRAAIYRRITAVHYLPPALPAGTRTYLLTQRFRV